MSKLKKQMDKEKVKWKDDILHSMKGSHRATPNPALFAKIEQQLSTSSAKVISVYQWRNYAAAMILILLMNTVVLFLFNQNMKLPTNDLAAAKLYNEPLITSFQIYN